MRSDIWERLWDEKGMGILCEEGSNGDMVGGRKGWGYRGRGVVGEGFVWEIECFIVLRIKE